MCDWCAIKKRKEYPCNRCARSFCVKCGLISRGIMNACPCRAGVRSKI